MLDMEPGAPASLASRSSAARVRQPLRTCPVKRQAAVGGVFALVVDREQRRGASQDDGEQPKALENAFAVRFVLRSFRVLHRGD